MAEQPAAMDVVEEEDVEIALHDVTLSGRIYRPQRREPADVPQPQSKSFAVIAHPWSRLGGSMDDRIVVILAYALISSSAAIPVITYNARGVGGSTGRSSWIGCETEKRDYEDVVRWGLHRFSMLEGGKEEEPIDEQAESDVTVYCCGYSHGSLLAPFTPSHRISHHHHGLHHKLITATGLTWKISFRYILISPPLTYAWFFMPFKRDAYDHALVNAMVMEVRRRRQMDYESWNCPILVLYGNGDQYLTDLTEWARLLRDRVEYAPEGDTRDADIALLRNVEFNCDHFWNSALARTRLVEVVQSWL